MLAKKGKDLVQSSFDYSGMSSELVHRSIERKARIKANEEVATKAFYDIAQDVKAQHDDLGDYKKWLEWCEKELGYKARMSESLLKIGTELPQRAAVKNLPSSFRSLDTLARALAKAESEDEKEQLLEQVETRTEELGKPLSEKEVKEVLAKVKEKLENDARWALNKSDAEIAEEYGIPDYAVAMAREAVTNQQIAQRLDRDREQYINDEFQAIAKRIEEFEAYCNEPDRQREIYTDNFNITKEAKKFKLAKEIAIQVVENKKKEYKLEQTKKQLESEKKNVEWQSNIIRKMQNEESEQVKKLEEKIALKDNQVREAQEQIALLEDELIEEQEKQIDLNKQLRYVSDELAQSMTTEAREKLEAKEADLNRQLDALKEREAIAKRMINEQNCILVSLKDTQSWLDCISEFNQYMTEIKSRLQFIAVKTTSLYPPEDLPKIREEFDIFVQNFMSFQEIATNVEKKISSFNFNSESSIINVEVSE